MTNYQLAKFLEKHNSIPTIYYLLSKVEVISKRESLQEFYEILINYDNRVCFYCGKNLNNKRSSNHIDHFIPWSFIQTDNIWNLVLACSSCNLSKNDKLADNLFLNSLVDRNNTLMHIPKVNINEEMATYSEKKLIDLYHYSIDNGITEIWTPN